jgi:transposase
MARRRRWSTAEKLRIVEETLQPGESILSVARRNGVSPNLLYRWRQLMMEGGGIAVQADDGVTGNSGVRRLKARVREMEHQLGRSTLKVEMLKEALDRSRLKKTELAHGVATAGQFPVRAVIATLGVSHANLVKRLDGRAKPRRRYQEAQDASVLMLLRRPSGPCLSRNSPLGCFVWARPDHSARIDKRRTYGCRRIMAPLRRAPSARSEPPANQKRDYVRIRPLLEARAALDQIDGWF